MSEALPRKRIVSPGKGVSVMLSSPEMPHSNPLPYDQSKPQSKGFGEEQLASDTPPLGTHQEACHGPLQRAPQQPNSSSGLDGYQWTGPPPPPCLVDVDKKPLRTRLPLDHDNESCSPSPHTSDSGLGSDLTPLTYHQFSMGNAPLDLVSRSSDSETSAETLLVSLCGTGPVEDVLVGPSLPEDQLQSDMTFLQEATGCDTTFLMSLYVKCCFDIERTVGIALAYPTADRYCSVSNVENETPSVLDLDELETGSSVVPDSGGDLRTFADDTGLTLKLNSSLATQLQKLFGPVDKSLFCGGKPYCLCTPCKVICVCIQTCVLMQVRKT